MEPTRVRKRSQERPVENTRTELLYAQIPLVLLTLPTGERAAAIEVWSSLHYHLRLGSSPQRITDEELATSPFLCARSSEHARKGLEVLERIKLIVRCARGSSRRVAITARLKGQKPLQSRLSSHQEARSSHRKAESSRQDIPAVGRAWEAWQLIRGN